MYHYREVLRSGEPDAQTGSQDYWTRHAPARRDGVRALGMATVYRNLKRLVADGTVRVITLPGENGRYEIGQAAHHHHFQCTTCRRVYDVPGCPGDLRRLAPRGFRVEHHDVTLYGRCSDCGKRDLHNTR